MKPLFEYLLENLEQDQINGFCILKPGFLDHEEDWLNMLQNNGWNIIQKVKRTLSEDEAKELYKMHKGKDFYDKLCRYMSSGDSICCMCYKECNDPIKEMDNIKDIVRKAWGIDDMKNAMHSSDSLENVKREYKLIFEHKHD